MTRSILGQDVGAITAGKLPQNEHRLEMQIVTNSTEEFLAALDRIKREGRRIVSAERAPGGHGWTITLTDNQRPIPETERFGLLDWGDSVGSHSPGGFGRI